MPEFSMTEEQFMRLWQLYNEHDPAFLLLPKYVQDAVKIMEREIEEKYA